MPSSTTSDALVNQLGLTDAVVDAESRRRSVTRFREQGIVLPTFAQLDGSGDARRRPDRGRRQGRR